MKKLFLLLILLPAVLACMCSGSASAVVPTVTPAPAETETSVLYIVTSSVLEVRALPGEKSLNVGYLEQGDSVSVYVTVKTTLEKCSTWGRIGPARWVCVDRLEPVNAYQ